MAILTILTYPDHRLKEISLNVEKVGDDIKKLVDDMLETMYQAKGIGLAAPQIGELKRILVIDIRRPNDPEDNEDEKQILTELESKVKFPLVLINPVVVKGEGATTYEEGCLSVPGYYEEVNRFNWVQVEALNRDGVKFKLETDGLLAICIQHEMDHLEGKLFIDRLSFVKSNKIKNKIKKLGYPAKKEREKKESTSSSLSNSVSNSKSNSVSHSSLKDKAKVEV